MTIRISRVHYPVTVLGPGRRLGIWLQGCGIGCAGCVSRDTWDPAGGVGTDVSALLAACGALVEDGRVDGVTLSGGEPFDQPEALGALVDGLREWGRTRGENLDVLCYSGRPERVLRRDFPHLLARLDAVVAGPYVAGLGVAHALAGSSNQRVIALSDLGRERLGVMASDRPRMQMAIDNDGVWMIGIPRSGDMTRIEEQLAVRGVRLEKVSWR